MNGYDRLIDYLFKKRKLKQEKCFDVYLYDNKPTAMGMTCEHYRTKMMYVLFHLN